MAVIAELAAAFVVMFPLLAQPVVAGSIADIDHVILFMQGASAPAVFNFISNKP